jgi:hypothetical protein
MGAVEGRRLVYLAAALFGLFWLFLSQTLPVWLEEVSVYPAPASTILAQPSPDDPRPSFEPSCADQGPVRLLTSGIRPHVALCFLGRQYPLLIMSYASGIPYWVSDLFWPIHRGRIFWLRGAGLLLGLLNIALTRRLLMRFADPLTANVAALCLAVTPTFLVVQSMLVHFEVLPWLACAAALDQLSLCRALSPYATNHVEPPPTARLLAAAALLGLALLSNVKAVFLIGPLCLLAFRAGVRFSALRFQQWLLVVAVLAMVVSPSLIGNAVDAGVGFSNQLHERLQMLVVQMNPANLVAEIPNVAQFWGDTLAFMAIASGDHGPPSIPGLLVTIPPLFYCLFSGVAFLWRGRGALVPAACGLLILTFMVVSALLYIGIPKGNYGPLYAVFGIATATTAVDAGGWLASRLHRPAGSTQLAIVVAMVGALIWGVVGRGSPTRFTTMSINAAAERGLGAYLTAHPEPDVPLLVTTYILMGVPEAVTGGAARGIKAANYFDGCPPGRNRERAPEPEALEQGRRCIQDRFERLLEAFPAPGRFVLPLRTAPVDDALAGEYARLLKAAATNAGRTFQEEASFSGWGTGPLLQLVRVGAATQSQSSGRRTSTLP